MDDDAQICRIHPGDVDLAGDEIADHARPPRDQRDAQCGPEIARVSGTRQFTRAGVRWTVPDRPPDLDAAAARALLRLIESAARRRAAR